VRPHCSHAGDSLGDPGAGGSNPSFRSPQHFLFAGDMTLKNHSSVKKVIPFWDHCRRCLFGPIVTFCPPINVERLVRRVMRARGYAGAWVSTLIGGRHVTTGGRSERPVSRTSATVWASTTLIGGRHVTIGGGHERPASITPPQPCGPARSTACPRKKE